MTSLKEQKINFMEKMGELTYLSRGDIGALARAYSVYQFFYHYEKQIVENNQGADIAVSFLRLTRISDINPRNFPGLEALNIKLTKALRDWIYAKGIPEFHDDEPPAGPQTDDIIENPTKYN